MPTIPYVKAGAPFIDHASHGDALFNAAKANLIDSGVYESMLQPCVRVYHNTTQSTTSGVPFVVAFNSERCDQAGGVADTMHDNVTNNSRLTCRYAGVYQITANINWAANPVNATLQIALNGSTTTIASTSGTADLRIMQVSTLYPLAVSDYVQAVVVQVSGGALNIAASSTGTTQHACEFMMVRVG